jgi:tRNA pseudouridine55 synthase
MLLVGDENKRRKEYEAMPKIYEFTVLLGVETDTYDILGKASASLIDPMHLKLGIGNLIFDIEQIFSGWDRKYLQQYPPYSSKAVKGKPLYWWARQNRLSEIIIPEREIEIYSLGLLSSGNITKQALRSTIFERINKVQGNFRQEEILKTWDAFLNHVTIQQYNNFPVLHCRVTCSSGTYVRSIAHELGKKLGTNAIALNIKRTSIGTYTLKNTLLLTT